MQVVADMRSSILFSLSNGLDQALCRAPNVRRIEVEMARIDAEHRARLQQEAAAASGDQME